MNNKIKVAILDSGINRNNHYLNNSVIGGHSLKKVGNGYEIVNDIYEDDNGHGTLCASVIKKECKDVEFYIVKILDKDARTNLKVLEEALTFFIGTDIKIINLSLAIVDKRKSRILKDLCNRLIDEGKIIVSSLANGFKKSYPACFRKVIGVKGFILQNEFDFWFSRKKKIQCIVDFNPYLHCYLHNEYLLYGKCNSYAAAKMTGIIANILIENKDISIKQLYNILELKASKNHWNWLNLRKSKRFPEFKENNLSIYDYEYNNIIKRIELLLVEFLYINDSSVLYKYNLFDKHVGLEYEQCYKLLKLIEKEFNIKFDIYTNISRYEFYSIYNLAFLIKCQINKENNEDII